MLIISRRTREKILFPTLDISLEITRIKGRLAVVGIEAPNGVKILRGELDDPIEKTNSNSKKPELRVLDRQAIHDLRNQFNSITMALYAIQRQSKLGREIDEEMLRQTIDELHSLEDGLLTGKSSKPENTDSVQSKEGNSKDAGGKEKGRKEERLALLVDDNENESNLLAAFLRTSGFKVVTALDGEAAISYLENCNQTPDIVLLDMNMPRLNGRETVRRIRSDESLRCLRLFAVSGYTPEDAKVEVGLNGVNRWFMKPLKPDALVSQIEKELVPS